MTVGWVRARVHARVAAHGAAGIVVVVEAFPRVDAAIVDVDAAADNVADVFGLDFSLNDDAYIDCAMGRRMYTEMVTWVTNHRRCTPAWSC